MCWGVDSAHGSPWTSNPTMPIYHKKPGFQMKEDRVNQFFERHTACSQIKAHPLFDEKRRQALNSPGGPHEVDLHRIGFLNLPGEIRNHIYRLTLTRENAVNGTLTKLPAIGLLRTCKQVYEEAASILYEDNTFVFGIEVKWFSLWRIKLYGFPPSLDVWPAPTYHRWLRKLHIQISFTPGRPVDFEAPCCLLDDIKMMRKAYDECWEDLEITYDLCEGTAHLLTFTMAWLKFKYFEPIAHPNCIVKTSDKVPPLVRWCLERTLKQRDLKLGLNEEQLLALREAQEIAEDSYNSGMRRCITDLSVRLVWGSPFETVSPPSLFHFGPSPPRRRRLYERHTMYRQVENTVLDQKAREILIEDNKLRTLAALEMPGEKDLLIKECSELRTYFALQEAAMKITALTCSQGK